MSAYNKCMIALAFFRILSFLSRMIDKTQSRTGKRLVLSAANLVHAVYGYWRWIEYRTSHKPIFGTDFK